MSLTRTEIPRKAAKDLIEYCEKKGHDTGESAAEMLKNYLKILKKHRSHLKTMWPEEQEIKFGLEDEDRKLIDQGRNQKSKLERFTFVCMKENMSLAGFDHKRFESSLKFIGRDACRGCCIPRASRVRKGLEELEQAKREVEEDLKKEEPSFVSIARAKNYKEPENVKRHKMEKVELQLYDDVGSVAGKTCEIRNRYMCPYGEFSNQLVEEGALAVFVWGALEWYDKYYNPRLRPGRGFKTSKWHRYDETGLIDVTEYEDTRKACEDGRLMKVLGEFMKYVKETGRSY